MKFLLFLLLVSCASSKPTYYNEQLLSPSEVNKLKDKRALYLGLGDTDEHGWIRDTKCDGLLFNSLYALGGSSTNLLVAEDEENPGKFFRSPLHDCYELKQSRSETSRDMYVGLMLWAFVNNRLDILNDIVKHGRNNSYAGYWVMGKEKTIIGSVDFRPDFIGTVFQVRYALGGADEIFRYNLQSYGDCEGYVCHVKALIIYLRYLAGMYNNDARKMLKKIADKNHNNAMTNAIYGIVENDKIYINNAYTSLMNERWFPGDRLPTNHDRCGFYLFERRIDSKSWNPCPDEPLKVWSGVDFIFTSALLTHEF